MMEESFELRIGIFVVVASFEHFVVPLELLAFADLILPLAYQPLVVFVVMVLVAYLVVGLVLAFDLDASGSSGDAVLYFDDTYLDHLWFVDCNHLFIRPFLLCVHLSFYCLGRIINDSFDHYFA